MLAGLLSLLRLFSLIQFNVITFCDTLSKLYGALVDGSFAFVHRDHCRAKIATDALSPRGQVAPELQLQFCCISTCAGKKDEDKKWVLEVRVHNDLEENDLFCQQDINIQVNTI